MKLNVNVTAKDIAKGIPSSGNTCMGYRALTRLCNKTKELKCRGVYTHDACIKVNDTVHCGIKIPDNIAKILEHYEKTDPFYDTLQPFNFIIDVPNPKDNKLTLVVKVKQKDIDNCDPQHYRKCAIGLALARTVKSFPELNTQRPQVHLDVININTTKYLLPTEAADKNIAHYKEIITPEPFTFELEVTLPDA